VPGAKWRHEKQWVCSDVSPLFFHVVLKLVQALFIRNDEIFQVLAVEENVLLLKPFLNLGTGGVARRRVFFFTLPNT
jgi:hypothetical protein